MPSRARIALRGAVAGVVLLIATWSVAYHVGFVERADRSIVLGFAGLHRPRVDQITNFIAHLCDPKPYLLLAAIPIGVALVRRRPRVAVTVGLIILAANVTTQLLKSILATPSRLPPVGPDSWPSGHATAAMALVLCAVIVAPARRRPVVGAVMAAFAVAVCYSFLELGWHYPADVLGGFLVATTWTLIGAAGLFTLEARRPARQHELSTSGEAAFSITEALRPVAILVAGALAVAGLVAVARPHAVVSYASAHMAFVAGAAGIAVLGLMIATAATLALRRS